MSEQRYEPAELQRLVDAMTSLVEYSSALRDGASVFAYAMPGDWQGTASTAFMGNFEGWSQNAQSMIGLAEGLRALVTASKGAYDGVISEVTTTWNTLNADLQA